MFVCVLVCSGSGEDERAGGVGQAAVPGVGPVSVSAARVPPEDQGLHQTCDSLSWPVSVRTPLFFKIRSFLEVGQSPELQPVNVWY